jgi:hypothetical protein
MFENRVLRRIFGPRGKEITEGFRKFHDEGLHIWYSGQVTEDDMGKMHPYGCE